jgi:hypothetical protein
MIGHERKTVLITRKLIRLNGNQIGVIEETTPDGANAGATGYRALPLDTGRCQMKSTTYQFALDHLLAGLGAGVVTAETLREHAPPRARRRDTDQLPLL